MKKIVLISEDRVGLLADITYIFSKMKIGIDSITASVIDNKGIIGIQVKNDVEKAIKILENNNFKPRITDSHLIKMKNTYENLSELMEDFKKANVSIDSISQLASDKENVIFELVTKNPLKTQKIIEKFIEKKEKDYEIRKKFDQI